MAARRMFTDKIVESDAFLEMPLSSQALYFHYCMNADDDGFVNNPTRIQRMIGAAIDDDKVLVAKSFILPFESGIKVIKHWRMHNLLRKDRYTETEYLEEKSRLFIKENGVYTFDENQGKPALATNRQPNGNQRLPQESVVKDNIGEDNKEKSVREKKDDDTTTTTTLKDFMKEFGIVKDTYSKQVDKMNYDALSKAYRESKWLQANITSLSRICRDYEKIIGNFYRDYKDPNKMENSHGYSKKQLDDLVDNIDDIDF